jgi:linoleoyl-CoA desaturase
MCHVNYATIAPVVEEVCREFGVKYKHNATLVSAVRSHYRWLRSMGRVPPVAAVAAANSAP